MELSLLILVCIHKSYIIYLEIYVVPIGHGFSFFGHGKSMLKKRGHPVSVSRHKNVCRQSADMNRLIEKAATVKSDLLDLVWSDSFVG